MEIKIKYLPGATRLEWNPKGNWIDLYAYEDKILKKEEYGLISLGVAMELPNGYEAHLAPRSSTYKTWGILQTNSVGILDETFRGDGDIWHFPAYATKDTIIKKGDKICQFRIMRVQPDFSFIETANLGNDNRGSFGSTGAK